MNRMRALDVDAAKGLAIVLVVYWHAVGDRVGLNEPLIFLRMPLFFMASGFFAAGALRMDWTTFLREKVGNTLYLYVFWTFAVFGATSGAAALITGQLGELDFARPFRLFVEPPKTLWFMYALAIVFVGTKLVQRLPWGLVFVALLAAYGWSVSSLPDWRDVPFMHRVIRLAPFFFLAVHAAPALRAAAARIGAIGPLLLAGFCVAAWHAYSDVTLRGIPVITFGLGLAGVLGVLATAHVLAATPAIRMLAAVGRDSMFIYVMHRIPLFYINHAAERLGFADNVFVLSIAALVCSALCYVVGVRVLTPLAPWSIKAPWLLGRTTSKAATA